MREKTASDIFRYYGVPATRTAFYEIYIDKGTGSYQYFGLYTMNEVVFDSFLNNYFGSESGNCYKPDGDGAKFSVTGFSLADFEKKTNEATGRDDIQAMYVDFGCLYFFCFYSGFLELRSQTLCKLQIA